MRQVLAVSVACALIAALAGPAALAQERAPRLGVVDMGKVLDGYKEYQQSDQQYRDLWRERQAQIESRAALRLLTAEELKEHQNLQAVAAHSEEQKQRLEQLKTTAELRETELKGLQTLSNPTDEQKQRLAELQQLARASEAELQQMQERAAKELSERNKELSDKLKAKINAALAVLAREKRIDVILDKDAVLYGGLDLTADLLTKLNSGA